MNVTEYSWEMPKYVFVEALPLPDTISADLSSRQGIWECQILHFQQCDCIGQGSRKREFEISSHCQDKDLQSWISLGYRAYKFLREHM